MPHPDQVRDLVSQLHSAARRGVLDSQFDDLLSQAATEEWLLAVIAEVDVALSTARALYRASERLGGVAQLHARWLLAGALSLEGLDDVARAVEPAQAASGVLKRSYLP